MRKDLEIEFRKDFHSIIMSFNELSSYKDNSLLEIIDQKKEFKRWLILLMFLLLTFMNGLSWGTFGSIIEEAEKYYEGSILLTKSFSKSLNLACFLLCLGAWIRYFAASNFLLCLIGQIILTISSCLIFPAPNRLGNIWFYAKERFMIVCICIFTNTFGSGLGILFSGLILKNDYKNIEFLLLIESILNTLPLIFCLLMVKEKQQNINLINKREKSRILFLFKTLFCNKKYIFSCLAFGINYTHCWGMLTICTLYFSEKGFQSIELGIISLVYVLLGLLSSLFGTIILRYFSKKYFDIILKSLFSISLLSFSIFSILLLFEINLYYYALIFLFIGFGAIGIQSFACESLEENAFPINESLAVNGLYFFSCIFGSPIILFSLGYGIYGVWILTISYFPLAFYIIFFYKTDFKKSAFETSFYNSFS